MKTVKRNPYLGESPWYDLRGWLGVKQLSIYLSIYLSVPWDEKENKKRQTLLACLQNASRWHLFVGAMLLKSASLSLLVRPTCPEPAINPAINQGTLLSHTGSPQQTTLTRGVHGWRSEGRLAEWRPTACAVCRPLCSSHAWGVPLHLLPFPYPVLQLLFLRMTEQKHNFVS